MEIRLLAGACLLLAALPGFTADAPAKPKYRSAGDIIAAAPESDWRIPDPANLRYMDLATGRVIIELAPRFSPAHAGNTRTLAHEHFWDGTSIYRAQDHFVVQFGDADADDATKAKSLGTAKPHLPAEFHRDVKGLAFDALPDSDGWAPQVGFVDGFAVGRNPKAGRAWLAHCYGTVVGKVLVGMELLSVIPRGPPPMGFYDNAAQRTPIRSLRLASDVPEAERVSLRVLPG